jgi:uncharacterized protein YegJ (DUF2314 family)
LGIADANGGKTYLIIRPGQLDESEYFWVVDLRAAGDGFQGAIGNDPEKIRSVTMGQKLHFSKDDIADWMYFQDGKIKGNATACPALAHAPVDERNMMREKFGIICD